MKPLRIGREHKRGGDWLCTKVLRNDMLPIQRRKKKNVFDLKRGDFCKELMNG
jgi:hypothetical protein